MDERRAPEYWAEWHHHEEWWSGPLHVIALVLLIALLVVGVVWLVRGLASRGVGVTAGPASGAAVTAGAAVPGPADPAVEALRMRYARGEVGRDEFRRVLDDLTAPAGPWPGEAIDESPPTAS